MRQVASNPDEPGAAPWTSCRSPHAGSLSRDAHLRTALDPAAHPALPRPGAVRGVGGDAGAGRPRPGSVGRAAPGPGQGPDRQIGTVSIVVGALVLLLWIPLRQRPGLGTVSNVLVVGLAMNATLALLPVQHGLPARVATLVGAVLLCGLATGMYITAGFGPGPRDGLMTGIARRTGRSIRLSRTVVELTVLLAGWLLGGTVGVGTVIFALTIGPLAQLFLRVFARLGLDSSHVVVAGRPSGQPAPAQPVSAA